MGPEGSLQQHLDALSDGDVTASFKFVAPCVYSGEHPLQSYMEQLNSPLFRPLMSHISAQARTAFTMHDSAQTFDYRTLHTARHTYLSLCNDGERMQVMMKACIVRV